MSQQGKLSNGGTTDFETLTGNTGGPVGPDPSGNINLLGQDTVTVTGNPGTFTLTIEATAGGYPITPYVVGPVGEAGYQTIQDGLDAANAAGGGVVYIQPGAYTEDLTLYDGVHLYGTPAVSQNQGASVSITGTHTPPSSGQVAFNSIVWISTTNVFDSAAAGTTHLAFLNCESAVQNGFFLNLPNWTGILEVYDNNAVTAGAPFAVNDGGINNSGGATLLCFSAGLGSGTNTAVLTGVVICQDMGFGCPVDFQTGSNIQCETVIFDAFVTCSNNSTGFFRSCHFEPSTGVAALTMNSSGDIELSNSIVDTPNTPAISGTGVGTLTLANVTFIDDSTLASTLTLGNTDTIRGSKFETNVATAGSSLSGNTLASDGSDANIDLNLSTKGTGKVLINYATPNAVTVYGTAGALDEVGPLTNGQLVIGSTGVAPVAGAITSTGGTITVSLGAGTINLEVDGSVATTFDADTGSATPAANTITFAGGVGCSTSAAGSTVTINAEGGGLDWSVETGTTRNLTANTGNIGNNAAGVTFTLPATATVGDTIAVTGLQASWTIAQNAGQTIHFGASSTTTGAGGSLVSTDARDVVTLVCVVTDTDFQVISSIGNITVN